ncbi:hypothetical protein [Leptolinea tardivitalis]|uniref:Uncharacterized protein n=1 Tax=Leptolinea tardivitalis TaxID=229920 RepID=A0A0P6X1I5_9CHLR|nr:hypothetical protein [Leptolinea tardivitalis]KPL74784.1 hypothetical protein ADM99_01530 [Leptolinea tardivitalis]GAP22842.1 hypothetical protein LTAR_03084 [Leptolinea tardivitalis]
MKTVRKRIDSGRLSIVMAAILLAYSLTPFIKIPNRELNLQLPGFLFILRVDYTGLVSILAAGLGATGMSWLLHSRMDELYNGKEFQHLLLPAMTAWAIGVPLGALEINLQWWAVFIFGGLLLGVVFYAEFIVVDFTDARYDLAVISLTAVGYAVYLILCVALRGAGIRLYLTLPVYFLTAGLISWRVLSLRLREKKLLHWSIVTAFVTTQVAIGLHYLPIFPIQFGLFLTGLCYACISFAVLYEHKLDMHKNWMEPVLILFLFVGVAFVIHP